MQTNTIQYII